MLASANFKEADVHIADLLAKSAGGKIPLTCQKSVFLAESADGGISEDLQQSALPADSAGDEISEDLQKSALPADSAGDEISEDLHKSDLPAESGDGRGSKSSKISDWRNPVITYLQDPNQKTNKAVWRLAIKYTLVDDDLYRRTADGLLLKCLDEDQARVAMGEVHDGLCGTHQSAHKMKWMLRRAGFYWPTMINDCF